MTALEINMQEAKIKRVYRHFKGDYYLLEDVATHSETGEQYAVYRKLYGDGSLWVRPLEMFLGEVDRRKYPQASQRFRFQLMDIASAAHRDESAEIRTRSVCLINDSFPPEIDGVANAVKNYAAVINGGLGRAVVVTPDHPQADDSVFDFPVLRYPSVDMTKQIGYMAGLPFSPEIQRQLREAKIDIIHSHCPITSTMLARMLRSQLDVPVVFTYHTKFDIDIANAIDSRLLQDEAKRILVQNISACNEIWVVSRGAGENLRALGFEGSYTVMPNGVDLPKGRISDELICRATGSYDLPDGVPMFLFVGRMMWYKGVRISLDALRLLRERGHDFRMVFVGGGADKDEIVEYTEKLGLSDRVFFCPPIQDREQIRAWYCRADMFLFPSTFDTNGLVVREAAACSLGSVLVRGSCAAEDVTDGINGFLIEENAQSMAAMLERLCKEPELMRRIGERAAKDLYMSWEESVANAYSRYDAVIDNYRRGLCPAKAELSDDFFRGAGLAMSAINRARDRRELLRSEVTDAYEDIVQEVREGRAKSGERIKERLNDITQHLDRFL